MSWPLTATGLLAIVSLSARAQVPPVEAFAAAPQMIEPLLSADGQSLVYRVMRDDSTLVAVLDFSSGTHKVVMNTGKASVSWCRWASRTRILCGVYAPDPMGQTEHPGKRTLLVGVNADGSDYRVFTAFDPIRDRYDEQMVDLTAADPGSVLLQQFYRSPVELTAPPAARFSEARIMRLDVRSGQLTTVAQSSRIMNPGTRFIGSDEEQVFISETINNEQRLYHARRPGSEQWHLLFSHELVENPPRPVPVAVIPGTQRAYAIGVEARNVALFEMDLARREPDRRIQEWPGADRGELLRSGDDRVLGIRLHVNGRPSAHYFHKRDRGVAHAADKLLRDRYNEIVDVSAQRNVYLLRTSSDVDAGTYLRLDARKGSGEFVQIGVTHTHLDQERLSRMQAIVLETDAGRSFTVFITKPLAATGKLPTVVMPDDGPLGEASWQFGFLRHFLVSRGYAVLQPRLAETASASDGTVVRTGLAGSAYDAMVRATRWGIEQGVADPQRVALVGWGFGGYLALAGSQQHPDLYRAVVGINAVTDLDEQPGNAPMGEAEDSDETVHPVSLRAQAQRTRAPVLLIYGTHDTVVHPHHPRRMGRALTLTLRPYEILKIPGAMHGLDLPREREILLQAVETFLARNLSASPSTTE